MNFVPLQIDEKDAAREPTSPFRRGIGVDTLVPILQATSPVRSRGSGELFERRILGMKLSDLIPEQEGLGPALLEAAQATPSDGVCFTTNGRAEEALFRVQEPLVVVIVSTFNCAGYVLETLESVRSQDHAPLLVVVVDDGSSDDTAAVVESFMTLHANTTPVAFAKIPHMGNPGITRNIGLRCLCPPHVAAIGFMDGDDKYASATAVSCLLRALDQRPDTIAAFGDYDWIDQFGKPLARAGGLVAGPRWRRRRRLTWHNIAIGNLTVFHLQCLLVRRGSPFLPYRPHGEDAEYYCFLFRLSAELHGGELDGINQVPALIAHYRKHDASLTARPVTVPWEEKPRNRRYTVPLGHVPRFYDLAGVPDRHVTPANISKWRSRQFSREFLRAASRGEMRQALLATRAALVTPGVMVRHVFTLPWVELFSDPSARDVFRRTLRRLIASRR
jgi:glycosyltransferase involved in cell wall biosynthesis